MSIDIEIYPFQVFNFSEVVISFPVLTTWSVRVEDPWDVLKKKKKKSLNEKWEPKFKDIWLTEAYLSRKIQKLYYFYIIFC